MGESDLGFASRAVRDGLITYFVQTPEGAVGLLSGWELDELERPTEIVVTQGWFGRRRLRVPVAAIEQIDHESRRIILRSGAAPLECSRVWQRLVEQLYPPTKSPAG